MDSFLLHLDGLNKQMWVTAPKVSVAIKSALNKLQPSDKSKLTGIYCLDCEYEEGSSSRKIMSYLPFF